MPTKPKTTGRAKSFTIDRSKWLQGGLIKRHPATMSRLRNHKGQMCCLGFYSAACGATGLTNKLTPAGLGFQEVEKLDHRIAKEEYSFIRNTPTTENLMSINDREDISDKQREERVKKNFARIGVKVKFIGKYPYAKK